MKKDLPEVKDATPANQEVEPLKDQEIKTKDFVSILKDEFLSRPFLTLLQQYLSAANGGKKTKENCLSSFKEKHPQTFKTVFFLDALLRTVYLLVVLSMVIRGLGLVEFFKLIFEFK